MKPYPWLLFIRIGIEEGQPVEEYGLSLDTRFGKRELHLIFFSWKKEVWGIFSSPFVYGTTTKEPVLVPPAVKPVPVVQ